jgi:hypothetical protein
MRRWTRWPVRSSQIAGLEMRLFGRMSVQETAEVLKVSPVTVMRDWNREKMCSIAN